MRSCLSILAASAHSGQSFRWRRIDNTWHGVDGDRWWRVSDSIESNAGPDTLEHYLATDHDFEGLRTVVERHLPGLLPALDLAPSLRVLRQSNVAEVLFGFLCSANNSLHRIVPMANCLASYGDPFPSHDDYRFPSVARLAEVTESELRSRAFGYRAKSIPLAAREIVARGGEQYLASLRELTNIEARKNLVSLPGIGPKIADCICLFGTGHTESVPVDTHIWQAATRLIFPQWQGETLTTARYQAVTETLQSRFGHQAGWVQQYMFVWNRTARF